MRELSEFPSFPSCLIKLYKSIKSTELVLKDFFGISMEGMRVFRDRVPWEEMLVFFENKIQNYVL